ncbi:HD domain-containing protein [Pelagibius sp. Alg239-R121]|uniref:HD domain-containing protein n=1 Tax=Pelagibius sp. Alg239-R121 TaxID=2993448 RepID=UPI0024A6867A|nr:HD domain-containing protein [Pelagibius sp. Alg239-R121]
MTEAIAAQDSVEPGDTEDRTVSFTQMKDGTREEYLLLQRYEAAHHTDTAERLLREMRLQAEETIPGYQITRLEHALQSATRAHREGAGLDWVVATLLHDIGDGLAPQNHDRFAAEILRPFVRDEVTWVVERHGAFQMVYYAHHYGWDQYEREKYRDNPYYQTCVDFCERWDQSSFDPAYESEPLAFFEPMVREVFLRKAYDEAVLQTGVVKGLAA